MPPHSTVLSTEIQQDSMLGGQGQTYISNHLKLLVHKNYLTCVSVQNPLFRILI
jgi:hypothetical protein